MTVRGEKDGGDIQVFAEKKSPYPTVSKQVEKGDDQKIWSGEESL